MGYTKWWETQKHRGTREWREVRLWCWLWALWAFREHSLFPSPPSKLLSIDMYIERTHTHTHIYIYTFWFSCKHRIRFLHSGRLKPTLYVVLAAALGDWIQIQSFMESEGEETLARLLLFIELSLPKTQFHTLSLSPSSLCILSQKTIAPETETGLGLDWASGECRLCSR